MSKPSSKFRPGLAGVRFNHHQMSNMSNRGKLTFAATGSTGSAKCTWCNGDGWDSPFKQFNGRKRRKCKGSGRKPLTQITLEVPHGI